MDYSYIIIGMYLWAGLTNLLWHFDKRGGFEGDDRMGVAFELIAFILFWPLRPILWLLFET